MFTNKELKEAEKLMENIMDNEDVPKLEETRDMFSRGVYPDYWYDENHGMLYKKITITITAKDGSKNKNHIYKHIA